MKQQHILIVNQHAPYGSAKAYEALDLALAAATFDQHVDLLFLGAGCYQLIQAQNSNAIEAKSFSKMMAALPVYGIDTLLYEQDSLTKLGLKASQLAAPCKAVTHDEIASLYQQADHVFHF